jgi:hypothetical protein
MPTLNPRITVTLTPAVSAVMKRMSELTGNSQSAIVGELLEEARPIFERMVQVMQAAKDVKGRVKEDLIQSMEGVQDRLEKQLGLLEPLFEEESRSLLERAEKVARRGTGEARLRSDASEPRSVSTPISNRGVTPHAKGEKKAAASERDVEAAAAAKRLGVKWTPSRRRADRG